MSGISVLMNTYNRGYLLRFAMLSYLRQTEGDFELVVADDGSTDETPELVERFKQEAPFDVTFVTHENKGHRRAAIINKGIKACKHDWILMTDCDSLAMPDLIEVHRANMDESRMLCGGYVRLTKEETDPLTEEFVRAGKYEEFMGMGRKIHIWKKHMKASWQIMSKKPRRPHNMGLNYSVSKKAMYAINGYNEAFQGWGSADGDVRERLRKVGTHPFSLYGSAIVMHMWHPTETTKTKEGKARNRAIANQKDAPTFCERGLVSPDGQ